MTDVQKQTQDMLNGSRIDIAAAERARLASIEFTEMEQRVGGGGAGAIGWLAVALAIALGLMLATLWVWM